MINPGGKKKVRKSTEITEGKNLSDIIKNNF